MRLPEIIQDVWMNQFILQKKEKIHTDTPIHIQIACLVAYFCDLLFVVHCSLRPQ